MQAHPIFVNNPVLFYPDGVRSDERKKPAICFLVDGDEFVDVLEFRNGMNFQHRGVRHVDDPALQTQPGSKVQGAWDYAPGVAYDFDKPEQGEVVSHRDAEQVADDIDSRILTLAREGKDPKQIATALSTKGWNAERVKAVLDRYREGVTAT